MSGSEVGRGILTAAVTPFDRQGLVDEVALAELVDFYATAGVQGVFALGTAAEAMLMDERERGRVAESICDSLSGRLPVLLHCGAPDTATTVRLVRHAESLGIGQVAVIAPYYYRYSPREVEAHFLAVADAATASVYVYDNPGTVGYEVGVAAVARLMSASSRVVGVKDTGDSIGRVVGYLALDRPPRIYTGNNELIHASLAVGADGAVSALSAALPELIGAIHLHHSTGDLEGSLRLQLIVARVMAAIRGLPYLGAIKAIAGMRGLPVGELRSPHRGLDPEEITALRRRLDTIDGLAEYLRAP